MIRHAFTAMFAMALMFIAGCGLIGVIAAKVPKPPKPAEYQLAGQSVGIMVWADRGLLIDWSLIQLDLAGGVQARLIEAQKTKTKDLEGTTFPVLPESIIRWQRDNPGYEAEAVVQFAPRLGVDRLIYIEITQFGTRAAQTIALYRGTATAKVRVVEVVNGKGKIVYESQDVKVAFPKTSTPEGSPRGSDRAMYVGTIQMLADNVARLFVEHPQE